eukprot:Skav220541  [mRNA]  locus=scaffold1683:131972:140653:- [translate_table: standard]
MSGSLVSLDRDGARQIAMAQEIAVDEEALLQNDAGGIAGALAVDKLYVVDSLFARRDASQVRSVVEKEGLAESLFARPSEDAKVLGASFVQAVPGRNLDVAVLDPQAGDLGAPRASCAESLVQARCAEFCEAEFELFCFPGDSKAAHLAKNSRGTLVMRVQAAKSLWEVLLHMFQVQSEEDGSWELRFDPVVAFLHRAPELEAEVLQITHEQGGQYRAGVQLWAEFDVD